MNKPSVRCVFSLFLLLIAPVCFGETDYKQVLLEAMRSPSGKASEDVSGEIADTIRQIIKRPNAVIRADVSTKGKLAQEGCQRLGVRFTSPGTLLPLSNGSSRMLDFEFELNMCENGKPPRGES